MCILLTAQYGMCPQGHKAYCGGEDYGDSCGQEVEVKDENGKKKKVRCTELRYKPGTTKHRGEFLYFPVRLCRMRLF